MKSNILSIFVFLIGLIASYFISAQLENKKINKLDKEMQIVGKTIKFNIQNSIEKNAAYIQLFINHWQSIDQLNNHWYDDINALTRMNKFISDVKLFPVIDENMFNLPDNALITADSNIQRKRQLRARIHLPMDSNQVIPSFIYTSRSPSKTENKMELNLQFPILVDNKLIAYVEVPLLIDELLRYKLDNYQITKPFALSKNGITLFSSLPEKAHINDITQQLTLSIFGHSWKLIIWSDINPESNNFFLIFSFLFSFILAVAVKSLILNRELSKQNEKNNIQLKRIDEEYKSNQIKLVQSNKLASLGEMASGIAHEINQPLQIICIHTELCLENLNNAQYNLVEKNFKAIIEQSERIEKIVKQVGSFGRDSKSDDYQKEDPNEIFSNVITIASSQYKKENIELRQLIYPSLPMLFCNKIQIEQVLINLLINARDAVETSEKKVVFFKAHIRGQYLYIQVSDSGTGIDPHKINDIFTPFYTTKALGKGTGLGLSISYSIIAQHKGEIEVTSEIGKGSVFTVKLPFEKQNIQRV